MALFFCRPANSLGLGLDKQVLSTWAQEEQDQQGSSCKTLPESQGELNLEGRGTKHSHLSYRVEGSLPPSPQFSTEHHSFSHSYSWITIFKSWQELARATGAQGQTWLCETLSPKTNKRKTKRRKEGRDWEREKQNKQPFWILRVFLEVAQTHS